MVSYSVEPAKSARSTCKGCKLTIGVDVLRFGSHREVQTSNGEHTQAFWSHPGCVTLKVFENAIEAHGSLEGIPGVTEHNALDELEKDYAKSKTTADAAAAEKQRVKEETAAEKATEKLAEKEAKEQAKAEAKEAKEAAKDVPAKIKKQIATKTAGEPKKRKVDAPPAKAAKKGKTGAKAAKKKVPASPA